MGHIVIVGAGEVGYYIAQRLSRQKWDVAVIDHNAENVDRVAHALDVQVIQGSGSSPQTLREAGIEKSEMLVAVTDSDETNIVACFVANAYAPPLCQKIARIRNSDYTDDAKLLGRGQIGLDFHINPELEAANKFLRLLQVPQATNVLSFAQGRVLLLGLRLPHGSDLHGKTFAQIGASYPSHRFLAAAIERNGTIIIPRGDNCLQPDDTLYLVISPENRDTTLEMLGIQVRPIRHVAIFGGGWIGYYLASHLEAQGVSVRLLERNRSRCEQLAQTLHRSVIIRGDATDRSILEEENIQKMDAFIAVTGDEEDNILSSLIAKRIGCPKVLSLVNKPSYEPLIRNVGVDAAISPRQLATSLILHFIRRGKVLQVDALGEEQAEAIEFVAELGSRIVGVPLAEAGLPKDALIGAIVREDEVIIPKGNTVIQPNDHVIVFALQDAVSSIERSFFCA